MSEATWVPARMVNEWVYCPRLAHLEWVQGEFLANADTRQGSFVHRRVDQGGGAAPEAEDAPCGPWKARALSLSSDRLGVVAVMDLVEGDGDAVLPVDTKKGAAPKIPEGAYLPERVQLCLQGLILQDAGYRCDRGVLYFAQSKQRVEVLFTPELIATTETAVAQLRASALGPIPPPLVDSPKCLRCSLAPICLPDEVHALGQLEDAGSDAPSKKVRRIVPQMGQTFPLVVQEQGAYLSKDGERLVVKKEGQILVEAKLFETAHVVLVGNIQSSTQALRALMEREIPVVYFTPGGYFSGLTQGLGHKNAQLRIQQHAVAAHAERSLEVAKRMVKAKIKNGRTLLRRNHSEGQGEKSLLLLEQLAHRVEAVDEAASLLGVEGLAARHYFEAFGQILRPKQDEMGAFDFNGRNRRPPRDPVNAMLSFVYALLTKDPTIALVSSGLDPYVGFYHRPKHGKPALALDLMEEFRPLVADSVVLTLVNHGEVGPSDFVVRAGVAALSPGGRKAVIAAYERRMATEVKHPIFGYSISYRRTLEVQARLLGRWLLGEFPHYQPFKTR